MNTTPRAVAGRWRATTIPATSIDAPSRARLISALEATEPPSSSRSSAFRNLPLRMLSIEASTLSSSLV